MGGNRAHDAHKIGRHVGHGQAQEVFDLRQRNQDCDAVTKADHHRHRDKAHQRAQAQQAHGQEHDAGHGGGDHQIGHAITLHDSVDDHDECAGWSAHLYPATAQQRDQKARNDGGE